MKKSRKVFYTAAAIVAALVTLLCGCSNALSGDTTRASALTLNSSTDSLAFLAECFVPLISNNQSRALLAELALHDENSNYGEILFEDIESINASKDGRDLTFRQLLEESIYSKHSGTTLTDLLADLPYFSIYYHLPKDIESPDPLVTYVDYTVDEKEIDQLIAYDSRGNMRLIDAKADPTSPVFVLGQSESLLLNDDIVASRRVVTPSETLAGHHLLWKATSITGTGNLSYLEAWYKGPAELFLNVFCLDGSDTDFLWQNEVPFPRDEWAEDGPDWYNHSDKDLGTWIDAEHGTKMGFYVVEWDPESGSTENYTWDVFEIQSNETSPTTFNSACEEVGGIAIYSSTEANPVEMGFPFGVDIRIGYNN